ncbi:LAFA_0C01090g1_1 [Lachancea sp. 'fantastica']|nr:LAFA_0C01090g1_1 [Lachancea sp. 'fantastica']
MTLLYGTSTILSRSSKFPLRQHCSNILKLASFSNKTSLTPEQWLEALNIRTLPSKSFSFQFDRSSGPGGQKVNKSSTKCTLTIYGFSKCAWIPQEVRNQLLAKNLRYWAQSKDCIVIQSDQTRSRETNKELCLEKLVKEIKDICWFAKPVSSQNLEKWESVRRKTKESRLEEKKFRSDKKQLRQKPNFF